MPDHEPSGAASGSDMCSYAIDVWPADTALLTDEHALVSLLRRAAAAGRAVVLGEAAYRFPNGAVTAVLLLSQSHLSVHTWPEYGSANVDLLTCGRLNGESMIGYLTAALNPTRCHTRRVARTVSHPVSEPS